MCRGPRAISGSSMISTPPISSFLAICASSLPERCRPLLQLSADSEHPTLEEVMKAWAIAEAKAPEGHEYLHGISYWMAIGDHFYQIQHSSLQAKAMEEYLTWLLRDRSGVISSSHYVELQAEFDRAAACRSSGTRTVSGTRPPISTDLTSPRSPPICAGRVVDYEAHERLADRIAAKWATGKKIIQELLGDVEADKLIASVPPDAALEVTVNIGYRATRRKLNKEFMGNLAAGLRNAPEGELRVRGKDGEIKGDDARLSQDMTLRRMSETSSLLDLEHVVAQMLEVHRRFLHDGKISEPGS